MIEKSLLSHSKSQCNWFSRESCWASLGVFRHVSLNWRGHTPVEKLGIPVGKARESIIQWEVDFCSKGSIFLMGLHVLCVKESIASSFYFIYSKPQRLGTLSFPVELGDKLSVFMFPDQFDSIFYGNDRLNTCAYYTGVKNKTKTLVSVNSSITSCVTMDEEPKGQCDHHGQVLTVGRW